MTAGVSHIVQPHTHLGVGGVGIQAPPLLCKPYRAKTKGKVERFNGYLRRRFYTPLASKLSQQGLCLDADTANAQVRVWLADVANTWVHGSTEKIPAHRLCSAQAHLHPLPKPWRASLPAASIPVERLPCRYDSTPVGNPPKNGGDQKWNFLAIG